MKAITLPKIGLLDGDEPIVILGPNGSGKTRLAKQIANSHEVTAISAQRRTWLDDNLQVQDESNIRQHVTNEQNRWRIHSYQPTEEVNHVLAQLIQEHHDALSKRNESAREAHTLLPPLEDGRLIRLQDLWGRLFPTRRMELGYRPKVRRTDVSPPLEPYSPKEMSDGERAVFYMAARVLTAERQIILIDEPEIHMHSRLAIAFWDEAQRLRPDCRFVYVTHDLNFTLSRHRATVLIAKSDQDVERLAMHEVPGSVAAEVIGAATLPFYAERIFLYEGEPSKGLASEFFSIWFDGDETFTIACGGRDSVSAAVTGLKQVGVSGASVVGLVDRDFYSDEVLANITAGVTVLPLHEIESVLCDQKVVEALAVHLGREPGTIWAGVLQAVRRDFSGKTLSHVVAQRVRSRVGDLLDGAFRGSQIQATVADTRDQHITALQTLGLPAKMDAMFLEEESRVNAALAAGSGQMLALLPGKHMLSLVAGELGLANADLAGLVLAALNRRQLQQPVALKILGQQIEAAFLAYLPPRTA